jgi:bis(5'-nucleosyl)-tetraphosphatase (symmetrical)
MDYAIGDVQGCFNTLSALLKKINFNIDRDRLYFLGDVVNRGTHSLETLRFIYSNKDNIDMVLGNHDFYLLFCAYTKKKLNKFDTFQDILNAPDKVNLLQYLIERPLAILHKESLLVHAGVPPQWSRSDVFKNASMVEQSLRSNSPYEFLYKMFGDLPHEWSENLSQEDKSRYTINALMRLRFCDKHGKLEFEHKEPNKCPKDYKAWFLHSNHAMNKEKIFFGHWSSLKNVDTKNIYPLDHGCIWGGQLTAYNLTNNNYISQGSIEI